MPRTREFDKDETLLKAMRVFWERGPRETTLADIEAETGVLRASLKLAFGDKQALFLSSLKTYQQSGREKLERTLNANPGRRGIEAWFKMLTGMCVGAAGSRGCMDINTAVQQMQHDPEVAKVVRDHHAQVEAMLAEAVQIGIEKRELNSEIDPVQAAKYLVSSIAGLHVTGQIAATRKEIEAVIRFVFRALD